MTFFEAYAVGIVNASVCTDLPVEEATRRLNREYPTGIESPWAVSDHETFASGEPHPCPCDRDETRTHYLFHC